MIIILKSIWSLPAGRDIWYDGYYGQPVALIDEFAGKASRIALAQLLRILDRYPIRVPFKGGFIPFIPKKIYITSNVHPSQWYDYTSRSTISPLYADESLWWSGSSESESFQLSFDVSNSPPNLPGS